MKFDRRIFRAIPGLIRYPDKLLNFLAYVVTRRKRNGTPRFLPFILDIEPTTYCNYKCTTCHVSDPEFVHRHMPLDTFKKIIDTNPQLIKIKLQGMGEPLMCPCFFDMVKYAGSNGVLVQTTTNGSMLDENRVEKLVNANLTSIGISVDGATRITYEKIRVNSDFDKMIAGVTRLSSRLKAGKKSTTLRAWTMFQNENRQEATEIVELCNKLGFTALVFQVFISDWGKGKWHHSNSEKMVKDFSQDPYLSQALKRAQELHFPVRIHTGNMYTRNKPCIWPWYSAYIAAGGEMVPCCILGDPAIKSFGEITGKPTLKEVWRSRPYQSFRDCHRNSAIPPFCSQCYIDASSQQ